MAAKPSLSFVVRWAACLVLGGVFGYAALIKLADPRSFAADIGRYHLLPHPLPLGLAVYLPWLELVCALAVMLRWWERGALAVLLSLCQLFSFALALAGLRGLDISCGCFGSKHDPTSLHFALLRAIGLGLIAWSLWRWPDPDTRRRSPPIVPRQSD